MGYTNIRPRHRATLTDTDIGLYVLCTSMLKNGSGCTLGDSDPRGYNLYNNLYHVDKEKWVQNAVLFGLQVDGNVVTFCDATGSVFTPL